MKDRNGRTPAMNEIIEGHTPQSGYYHDPTIKDNYGYTVAIWMVKKGITPPQKWHHHPSIMDNDGRTVEFYLKTHCADVPDFWQYCNVKDESGKTPAMIDAAKGIIPNISSQHDPDLMD